MGMACPPLLMMMTTTVAAMVVVVEEEEGEVEEMAEEEEDGVEGEDEDEGEEEGEEGVETKTLTLHVARPGYLVRQIGPALRVAIRTGLGVTRVTCVPGSGLLLRGRARPGRG